MKGVRMARIIGFGNRRKLGKLLNFVGRKLSGNALGINVAWWLAILRGSWAYKLLGGVLACVAQNSEI